MYSQNSDFIVCNLLNISDEEAMITEKIKAVNKAENCTNFLFSLFCLATIVFVLKTVFESSIITCFHYISKY